MDIWIALIILILIAVQGLLAFGWYRERQYSDNMMEYADRFRDSANELRHENWTLRNENSILQRKLIKPPPRPEDVLSE